MNPWRRAPDAKRLVCLVHDEGEPAVQEVWAGEPGYCSMTMLQQVAQRGMSLDAGWLGETM